MGCGDLCVPSPAPGPFIPSGGGGCAGVEADSEWRQDCEDCDASCGGSFHWSSDAGCQCDSIVQPPQTGYDSNCYIHSGCLTGKAGYSTDPNDSMGEGWYCTDGQYVDMNTKNCCQQPNSICHAKRVIAAGLFSRR